MIGRLSLLRGLVIVLSFLHELLSLSLLACYWDSVHPIPWSVYCRGPNNENPMKTNDNLMKTHENQLKTNDQWKSNETQWNTNQNSMKYKPKSNEKPIFTTDHHCCMRFCSNQLAKAVSGTGANSNEQLPHTHRLIAANHCFINGSLMVNPTFDQCLING